MAYDNNINPGKAPLVWSRIKSAFDQINENFSIIGASVAAYSPITIANIDQSNPVKITCTREHNMSNGWRVTIRSTGVSQLDDNDYYVQISSNDELLLYSDEALTTAVNGTAYDAYSSGGGTIQAYSDFASIDFENLTTSVSPETGSTYSLGDSTDTWKKLYISEYSDTPGNEQNGVWLGTAQIKGASGVVDLPFGSTINGDLIIDPEKRYFRYINLDDGDTVEADHTNDTLSIYSGTGMQLVAGSAADSITITNTGVTQLAAGTGISVDAATGNITVTNTGVISVSNGTSLPAIASGRSAGVGIITSGATGTLTLTNTGVIEVQAGTGITVFTDTATGIATITNSAPAGNAFRFVSIFGQTTIEADGVADTLEIAEGYGITLTTDAPNDKVTVSFDNTVDIIGSVFGDDSTKIVDAVENKVYAAGGFFGNLTGNVTGNITGDVTGNVTGNLVGDTTGYHTGDVKGSVFGDDSTKIVDAVENKVYADELWGTLRGQTWMAGYDGYLTIANGGSTGPGAIQIVASANLDLTAGSGYTINANRNIVASGGVTGNVTGNLTGYQTGDMTGSVFADDSTKLVDAVEGKIVGPIESESISGNLTGSVFADDSTTIIDGPTGTVAGIHVPGSTTPASEFADGQTYEIRVDDSFIWVKTSTGAWKKATLGSF